MALLSHIPGLQILSCCQTYVLNIYSATITCGSIKLTDIELELHNSDTSTSSLIYHCAESISANQTITSVCSSDGDSLWNPDPDSHGCTNISTDATGIYM